MEIKENIALDNYYFITCAIFSCDMAAIMALLNGLRHGAESQAFGLW